MRAAWPTDCMKPIMSDRRFGPMSSERLPMTAQIVQSNRSGGPEGVIDAVEQRAPDGFDNIDNVLSYEERKAIVRGYAAKAGFAKEQVNKGNKVA